MTQEADASEEPPLPSKDDCHSHDVNESCSCQQKEEGGEEEEHQHTSPPPQKKHADLDFVPLPPESMHSDKQPKQFINLPPQHAMLPAHHHHHHRHATQLQLTSLYNHSLFPFLSPPSSSSSPQHFLASSVSNVKTSPKLSQQQQQQQQQPSSSLTKTATSSSSSSSSSSTVSVPSLSTSALSSSLLGISTPSFTSHIADDALDETQKAFDGTKPFVIKTYELVNDPSSKNLVDDLAEFSSTVLPKYFKHNNFSSFVRQLNTYGFRKIESPEGICFQHDNFKFGCPQLLKNIQRKKPGSSLPANRRFSPPPIKSFQVPGNFGFPSSGSGMSTQKLNDIDATNVPMPSASSTSPATTSAIPPSTSSVTNCEVGINHLQYEVEELKKQQRACMNAVEEFRYFIEESRERDGYIFQKLQEITDFISSTYYNLPQQQQQQQQQEEEEGQEQQVQEYLLQQVEQNEENNLVQESGPFTQYEPINQWQQQQQQQVQLTHQITTKMSENNINNDNNDTDDENNF